MKQAIIDLIKKITKLIDLKSIITIGLVSTLIWGFVVKVVDSKDFLEYVGIVIVFYFTKKDKKEEKKPSEEEVG